MPFQHIHTNPVLLNDNKNILLVVRIWKEDQYSLFRYNIETDTLSEWMKLKTELPDRQKEAIDTVAINNDTIYFIMSFGGIVTYKISTNQWKDYEYINSEENYDDIVNGEGSAVTVGNDVHIICGTCNIHLIWKSDHYLQIDEFDDFEKGLGRCNGRIVYIKHQNKLLLLGGYDPGGEVYLDLIQSFDLEQIKWIETYKKLPYKEMFGFGCVVTCDEKYVLLFGGCFGDDMNRKDDIYIIDTDTLLIRKSMLKCPMANEYYAQLICNSDETQLIAMGYIRKIKQIPQDIIGLIQLFCLTETVHLFTKWSCNYPVTIHWKMSVERILNGTCDENKEGRLLFTSNLNKSIKEWCRSTCIKLSPSSSITFC